MAIATGEPLGLVPFVAQIAALGSKEMTRSIHLRGNIQHMRTGAGPQSKVPTGAIFESRGRGEGLGTISSSAGGGRDALLPLIGQILSLLWGKV